MANEENLKPFVKDDPRINRKGRPVVNDIKRFIKERLAEPIREPGAGEDPDKVPIKLETIIQKLLLMAKDGNLKALELALKYGYGNPTQALEVTGKDGQTLITHDFSKFTPEQLAEHISSIEKLLTNNPPAPESGAGEA